MKWYDTHKHNIIGRTGWNEMKHSTRDPEEAALVIKKAREIAMSCHQSQELLLILMEGIFKEEHLNAHCMRLLKTMRQKDLLKLIECPGLIRWFVSNILTVMGTFLHQSK